MGNKQAGQIVQAQSMKTNQDKTARPPILRYNIRTDDSGKPDNAVLNAATERPSLANFQILPSTRTEVFGCDMITYANFCLLN